MELHVFESLAVELQRPTVFSDSTNYIRGRSRWDFCLDFEGDLHLGIYQARQMLDNRGRYRINIAG